MRVYGFDIDGVVAQIPLYSFWKKFELDYFLHRAIMERSSFKRFFYHLLRRINPDIRQILIKLQGLSYRIVLISAVRIGYQEDVQNWLTQRKIPFDLLYLRDGHDSILEYKTLAVLRAGCHYYVDDRISVIQAVEALKIPCKLIHYQGQAPLVLEKMLDIG